MLHFLRDLLNLFAKLWDADDLSDETQLATEPLEELQELVNGPEQAPSQPSLKDIQFLAYLKWEAAQPSSKSSEEFWQEAEQELQG